MQTNTLISILVDDEERSNDFSDKENIDDDIPAANGDSHIPEVDTQE